MSATIIAAIAKAETTVATLTEKLKTATDKLDALRVLQAANDAVKDVAVGDIVVIAVGRGDTRRNVEAIIRAAKAEADEKGHRTLKVEYTGAFTPGFEGTIKFTPDAFSNEFSVISTAAVLEVIKAEVVAEEAADADLDAQIALANAQPAGIGFHADN